MAFDPLLSTETDAKSPIDQNLMDTIRLDFVGMCRVMFITFGESHA